LAHRPTLQRFFYNGWKHQRLEAELRRATERISKARVAGKKGGETAAFNREKERWQLQRIK
jgi:uncharacterized protein YdaU (DUF1376 family)